jgi:hypothetical protein
MHDRTNYVLQKSENNSGSDLLKVLCHKVFCFCFSVIRSSEYKFKLVVPQPGTWGLITGSFIGKYIFTPELYKIFNFGEIFKFKANPVLYSIRQKKCAFFKLVTELCQFLGGDWKVMSSIQQLSQPLYTEGKGREGRLFCQKNISAEV